MTVLYIMITMDNKKIRFTWGLENSTGYPINSIQKICIWRIHEFSNENTAQFIVPFINIMSSYHRDFYVISWIMMLDGFQQYTARKFTSCVQMPPISTTSDRQNNNSVTSYNTYGNTTKKGTNRQAACKDQFSRVIQQKKTEVEQQYIGNKWKVFVHCSMP